MSLINGVDKTGIMLGIHFADGGPELVGQPLNPTASNSSGGTVSRETQSIYQPSTGTDPSGHMDHSQRREEVKREMAGHWTEGDGSLIDTFFPLSSVSEEDIAHVKRELYDTKKKRWKGIPKKMTKEKLLVHAVLNIITTIQRHLEIGPERDLIDTQDHCITTHDGATLKPDVFLSVLGPLVSPSTTHEYKPSSFKQCGSFIEGKLHEKRNEADDRGQPGTYSREVFMAQSNRRFILSFFVTERLLQVYLFDRSGALLSDQLDYHGEPDQFCAIVAALLKMDIASLGFDPTVFYRTPSDQCITTLETMALGDTRRVVYIVEMLLMRSYTLVGAGTTYWRVKKEEDADPSARYIIKDSWVTSGTDNEAVLFQEAGAVQGVAMLVASEVVFTNTGSEDTTINNRLTQLAVTETINRTHKRIVYRQSGKLLDQYEDPLQLLFGFRDAVQAHGRLLSKGLLHRDIVPWNILINPKAHEGHRGCLIDLHCSMRIASPSRRVEQTPGSHWFLSRSMLKGAPHISHMDDLEGFFHVLLFFVVAHSGPALASTRIKEPGYIEGYGMKHTTALMTKEALFEAKNFKFTVQTGYFKQPIAELAESLHGFFYQKHLAVEALGTRDLFPPSNPPDDYVVFEDHFSTAIHKLSVLCGSYRSLSPSGTELVAGPSIPTVSRIIPQRAEDETADTTVAVHVSRKRRFSATHVASRMGLSRECKKARRGSFTT